MNKPTVTKEEILECFDCMEKGTSGDAECLKTKLRYNCLACKTGIRALIEKYGDGGLEEKKVEKNGNDRG